MEPGLVQVKVRVKEGRKRRIEYESEIIFFEGFLAPRPRVLDRAFGTIWLGLWRQCGTTAHSVGASIRSHKDWKSPRGKSDDVIPPFLKCSGQ